MISYYFLLYLRIISRLKNNTKYMNISGLMKLERELIGSTQEMYATELSKRHGLNVTLGQINGIENAKSTSDSRLQEALWKDFYFLDLEREKNIVTLAYELISGLTKMNVSIDLEELFFCVTKKDLIDLITKAILEIQSSNVGFFRHFMKDEKGVRLYLEDELCGFVDEVSIQSDLSKLFKEASNRCDFDEFLGELSNRFDLYENFDDLSKCIFFDLNNTAKLIFNLAYFYILLTVNKELKYSKKDYLLDGFKFEDIADYNVINKLTNIGSYFNIDDFREKSDSAKGKLIKILLEKIAIFNHVYKNPSLSIFWESFHVRSEDKNLIDDSNSSNGDSLKSADVDGVIKGVIPSFRYLVLLCFSFYQGKFPIFSEKLVEKLKGKFEIKQYFGSEKIKKLVSKTLDEISSESDLESNNKEMINELSSLDICYVNKLQIINLLKFNKYHFLFDLYMKNCSIESLIANYKEKPIL